MKTTIICNRMTQEVLFEYMFLINYKEPISSKSVFYSETIVIDMKSLSVVKLHHNTYLAAEVRFLALKIMTYTVPHTYIVLCVQTLEILATLFLQSLIYYVACLANNNL